jgi:hypothetical protein
MYLIMYIFIRTYMRKWTYIHIRIHTYTRTLATCIHTHIQGHRSGFTDLFFFFKGAETILIIHTQSEMTHNGVYCEWATWSTWDQKEIKL